MFITPKTLKQEQPLSDDLSYTINRWRGEITAILKGDDERQLLIVGPCSIHNVQSAFEYAARLKNLADTVRESFFIVMRTYFEKPRTCSGWKGLLYDPHLDGSCDIITGLRRTRAFLIELAQLGIPAATEFLDPHATPYFHDLISWGCIGARTSESQIHRQLATVLPMPIGFKNRPDGSIEPAVCGILQAQCPQRFLGMDEEGKIGIIQGQGNTFPHLVLRGGEKGPNYSATSIMHAHNRLQSFDLPQTVIVDCSHDNSRKNPHTQSAIFRSLIHCNSPRVQGIMLESFLQEGKQQVSSHVTSDISCTDPCLSWEATAAVITEGAEEVMKTRVLSNV